jgi:hypothetical protein
LERGYALESIQPCFIADLGNGVCEVDIDHPSYPRARTEIRPPTSSAVAADRSGWPLAARLLAKLATDADAGLGDTLYRAIGERNSERFSRTYKAVMGHDCGCATRRARMNARFPLR